MLWTGAEVASKTQRLLVVLAVAGMLGCSLNVFAYYLLANGRSRSNALISLVTAAVTLATSAIALPISDGRRRAGAPASACSRRSPSPWSCCGKAFRSTGMWSRVAHFVLLPLANRHRDGARVALFRWATVVRAPPHWWLVGVSYAWRPVSFLSSLSRFRGWARTVRCAGGIWA